MDVPRGALRRPRSLLSEQFGDHQVSRAQEPLRVNAWVVWEDGVEELVEAVATAWTKRAVLVQFGFPGHMHEVWVWAGAVERV
jgi:hypothetical protein